MAKAGQPFENPVTREQKDFNQTVYEPTGKVLDIECNILSVASWRTRFAAAYNYSVYHLWTCGWCRLRRGYSSRSMLEINGEEGKDGTARDLLHTIMLLQALEPVTYVGDWQL
jgi:hypothetical protein